MYYIYTNNMRLSFPVQHDNIKLLGCYGMGRGATLSNEMVDLKKTVNCIHPDDPNSQYFISLPVTLIVITRSCRDVECSVTSFVLTSVNLASFAGRQANKDVKIYASLLIVLRMRPLRDPVHLDALANMQRFQV